MDEDLVDVYFGFNTKSKNGKRQVLKLNKTLYGFVKVPERFESLKA